MKLALVHDWLRGIGGAERVLVELHRMFPEAPIYTLFYDPKFVMQWLPDVDIRSSFLQRIPLITRLYSLFSWLMPSAIESFDLSDFDTVLSSSAIFSKGLVLKPSTKHICYCYSPTRFAWDWHAEYSNDKDISWSGLVFQHLFRLWDRAAADRVDQFIAISKTVQARIKKYYGAESIVIYPATSIKNQVSSIEVSNKNIKHSVFNIVFNSSYFLIVSRLYKYKNIDIAIEAFNKLGYSLVIIGGGQDRKRLERLASKNITFLGEQDDSVLGAYYNACRAFIMPQEEDFGLTAVEAMSFGKPVIALRRGGATETLIEGHTGEFFQDPIPEALVDAIRRFNENYPNYDSNTIKTHASFFSPEKFKTEISKIID